MINITPRYSSLAEEAHRYWKWTKKHSIPQPNRLIAKEGAGSEWRTPLMHFGTVMPVYLAIERYLEVFPVKKDMKLIELGCGTGRALSYIKDRYPHLEVWGTDYSSSCISYAKKTYGKFGVKFVHATAQKTTLPTGKFDIVISSHVIEHIPKLEGTSFVKETYRLLRKDGFAFIGTPERRHCQNLYMKNPSDNPRYRLVPPHEHEYTLEELKKLGLLTFDSLQVRVDKLYNETFMDIFSSSIQHFRPQKSIRNTFSNMGYRLIRDYAPKDLFDRITTIGTLFTLKKKSVSFQDVLLDNAIKAEYTQGIADNLLLVCQK